MLRFHRQPLNIQAKVRRAWVHVRANHRCAKVKTRRPFILSRWRLYLLPLLHQQGHRPKGNRKGQVAQRSLFGCTKNQEMTFSSIHNIIFRTGSFSVVQVKSNCRTHCIRDGFLFLPMSPLRSSINGSSKPPPWLPSSSFLSLSLSFFFSYFFVYCFLLLEFFPCLDKAFRSSLFGIQPKPFDSVPLGGNWNFILG